MERYTEELKRQLYDSWQESGLAKKAFATEAGISPSTFYYWVKKFDQGQEGFSPKKGFRPILVDDVVPVSSVMATVRYPSGVSIEWHGGPETIHLLKTLL